MDPLPVYPEYSVRALQPDEYMVGMVGTFNPEHPMGILTFQDPSGDGVEFVTCLTCLGAALVGAVLEVPL